MAVRRYAAFLRGVSPMNLKMSDLLPCFEAAGFEDVKTVLSSGNVVFGARAAPVASLERRAEKAMKSDLGRTFLTFVRPIDALRAMLEKDPFSAHRLARGSKRVVTFLRKAPRTLPSLPIEVDRARILCLNESEIFTAYVRSPRGAVFMRLIEKTFGDEVTTRTWDTIAKVVAR